jgi:hypothetical protein
MIASMASFGALNVTAQDDWGVVTAVRTGQTPHARSEINIAGLSSRAEILIPPTNAVAVFGSISSAPAISLTFETWVDPDDFDVKSFSVDGGEKWRNVATGSKGTLSDAGIARLLNRGMTLHVANTPVDRATKQPAANLSGEGGAAVTILTFPAIGRRARIDRFAINYLAFADPTGMTPGAWALVNRDDAAAEGTALITAARTQMAKLEVAVPADGRRFGQNECQDWRWFGATTTGIAITALTTGSAITATTGRPDRNPYFIRMAPQSPSADNENMFIPASKARRIQVSGELKALRVPSIRNVKDGANTFAFRAGQVVVAVSSGTALTATETGRAVHLQAERGTITLAPGGTTIVMWTAATARRPATHPITFTAVSTATTRTGEAGIADLRRTNATPSSPPAGS